MDEAIASLCQYAVYQVEAGARLLILSDRQTSTGQAPIPALLATAAVHHHLIKTGMRARCGLIVETGEARRFTISAACSATVPVRWCPGWLTPPWTAWPGKAGWTVWMPEPPATAMLPPWARAFSKSCPRWGSPPCKATAGAQIFECVGLNRSIVDRWFTGTPSRIGGLDEEALAREIALRCNPAHKPIEAPADSLLDPGGRYKWRREGEVHQYNPTTIPLVQQAVRQNDAAAWRKFSDAVVGINQQEGLIRGLFDFEPADSPLPVEAVQPWTEIVKRFKTGAMSYGSISKEAHETQAIAMNRLGGQEQQRGRWGRCGSLCP